MRFGLFFPFHVLLYMVFVQLVHTAGVILPDQPISISFENNLVYFNQFNPYHGKTNTQSFWSYKWRCFLMQSFLEAFHFKSLLNQGYQASQLASYFHRVSSHIEMSEAKSVDALKDEELERVLENRIEFANKFTENYASGSDGRMIPFQHFQEFNNWVSGTSNGGMNIAEAMFWQLDPQNVKSGIEFYFQLSPPPLNAHDLNRLQKSVIKGKSNLIAACEGKKAARLYAAMLDKRMQGSQEDNEIVQKILEQMDKFQYKRLEKKFETHDSGSSSGY